MERLVAVVCSSDIGPACGRGQTPDAIVADGPRRVSRKPLYVGLLALYLALALNRILANLRPGDPSATLPDPYEHYEQLVPRLQEELAVPSPGVLIDPSDWAS